MTRRDMIGFFLCEMTGILALLIALVTPSTESFFYIFLGMVLLLYAFLRPTEKQEKESGALKLTSQKGRGEE